MRTRRGSRKNGLGLLSLFRDPAARIINLLLLLSLVTTVLFRVVFAESSTSIPDGSSIANLGSDIGVGYIAAWIVYYLTTWRPRRQDRNRAVLEVMRGALRVSGTAPGLLQRLRQALQDEATGPTTQKALVQLVGNSVTTSPSTMAGVTGVDARGNPQTAPTTLLDMFQYHRTRAKDGIESCMRLALYLDSDLVTGLQKILNCSFFERLQTFVEIPTIGTIRGLIPDIYDYFLICDELTDLLCDAYGEFVTEVGYSVPAVRANRAANGLIEWRVGFEAPDGW